MTNATVYQNCQIGLEVTPGVAVPANKLLLALGMEPGVQAQVSKFRPMGKKYTTLVIPNKEWTVVQLQGQPTFNELIYPLAAILEGDVATVGAVNTWDFGTTPGAPDAIESFTVEYGSSIGASARRFTNAVVRSLGLSFSRNNGISMRGEMIGKAIEEGITLTDSPESIELVPILPEQVQVYLDTSYLNLGDTELENCFMSEWNLNNKFNPKWVLNRNTSFGETVETPPEHTLTLRMEYDEQAEAMMTKFRGSELCFVRIEALGDVLSGADNYRFRLDFAGRISEPQRFSDEEGTYAIGYTLEAVEESAWGKVVEIELVNGESSL